MYCTYNVILRRVHVTAIGVGKQQILYICLCVCVCVCVGARVRVVACNLAYPECNAYTPYCDVICGSSGSISYFGIINDMIFAKKALNMKCVF